MPPFKGSCSPPFLKHRHTNTLMGPMGSFLGLEISKAHFTSTWNAGPLYRTQFHLLGESWDWSSHFHHGNTYRHFSHLRQGRTTPRFRSDSVVKTVPFNTGLLSARSTTEPFRASDPTLLPPCGWGWGKERDSSPDGQCLSNRNRT